MAKQGKGLAPRMFKGMSKERLARAGKGSFNRLKFEKEKPITVQFLGPPSDPDSFIEFEQHQFRDQGRWNYVPCAGDDCPLCEDEDSEVSKSRYRFAAVVYNLDDKSVQVMEGPQGLAIAIMRRYEKRPRTFMQKTWDVTQLDTQPVSYDVDQGEEDAVSTRSLKALDLGQYVTEAMTRYFGNDMPSSGGSKSSKRSALDDDDDAEEDVYTKSELQDMSNKELKRVAKEFKVSTEGRSKSAVISAIIRKQK